MSECLKCGIEGAAICYSCKKKDTVSAMASMDIVCGDRDRYREALEEIIWIVKDGYELRPIVDGVDEVAKEALDPKEDPK